MRFSSRMTVVALLASLLPILSFAADPPVADKLAEREAQELIKSIPVVTDADDKIETLILRGFLRVNESVSLESVATYRKPDQRFLSTWNPGSEVPIFMASHERMILFDPLDQRVWTTTAGHGPFFRLRKPSEKNVEFKNVQILWGVQIAQGNAVVKPAYLVDISSILAGSKDGVTITRNDKEVILSGFTNKGAELRAYLVPGTPFPCHRFELANQGEKEPALAVRIEVNAAVNWSRFRMPDIDVLKKRLDVVELDMDKNLLESFGRNIGPMILRIGAARMFARTPEGRAEAEKVLKRKIDWDAVQEFDRKAAEALREAMKTEPAPAPPASAFGHSPFSV